MTILKSLAVTSFIFLASCAGTDTADTSNLTGTWQVESVNSTYSTTNNELLGTYTESSTIYITETNAGIQISDCFRYIHSPRIQYELFKNGNTLSFINDLDTPFEIVNSQQLHKVFEDTYNNERTVYNQTLTKMSADIELSRGHLQINGAVTADNQSQVCLIQYASPTNDYKRYSIQIPFDNDVIELFIRSTQTLSVGTYTYDVNESGNSHVLYSFDVMSNANSFWDTVGSNTLSPALATLNITTSGPNLIEGNFSFVGQDTEDYQGSFSIVPY